MGETGLRLQTFIIKMASAGFIASLVFGAIVACAPARPISFQEASSTPIPAARWEKFSRGINTPFWFSDGSKNDTQWMRDWTTPEEIRLWSDLGIRNVRLPFLAKNLTTSYDPVRFDAAKLNVLKSTLRAFGENNILVTLDLHEPDPFKQKLKDNPREVEKLRNFWGALARELRGFDPETVAFEVLNEPNLDDADQWWDIQRVLAAEIRSAAPHHTIVVNADRWTSIDEMISRRPYADPNIVYAVHFYEPFIFTHQGATWVDDALGGWENVAYPSYASNNDTLKRQASSARHRDILERFTRENWGPAKLNQRIRVLGDWAQRHNVKVTINEFGSVRKGVRSEWRAAWTRDCRRAFEDQGFGWSFYEFRGGMGVTYANLTTPSGYQSSDMLMFDALGFKRPPNPSHSGNR